MLLTDSMVVVQVLASPDMVPPAYRHLVATIRDKVKPLHAVSIYC